ncbi:MAG TPA: CHAT domain-containing protein, partial [Cyclobacteriaceae bacterium]|nr:CHAT domain-containing protein [Cyclobacteriaceae bacterium]
NYSVLHFSTHGHAGWDNPLKGGLLLSDGELTLADLLDLPQNKIRLAVLSACETGVPGTNLPEETISLPSGCLQSGIAGVVGSLWSVSDFSTAMLFTRFYDLWRNEGLPPYIALCHAQLWIRDSTNFEKKSYFRSQLSKFTIDELPTGSVDAFSQYISLQDDETRKFDHPFYWAAFTYTGL